MKKIKKIIKESIPQPFKCRPDAERVLENLTKAADKNLHQVRGDVVEVPKYGRGRPKKGHCEAARSGLQGAADRAGRIHQHRTP